MEFFNLQNNKIVFNFNSSGCHKREFWRAIREINLSEIKIVDCSDCCQDSPLWEKSFNYLFPNVEEIILPSNLKTLKDNQFAGLKNLRIINIPGDLDILPEYLFDNCENLTEIKIPDSIKKISRACFCGSGLKEIEIPSSVEIICESAFSCPELTNVKFSEGIRIIEPHSFVGEKITELRLPSSLEQISHIIIPNGVLDLSQCVSIDNLDCYLTAEMVIMPPYLTTSKVRFQKNAVVFFGDQLTHIEAEFEHGEIYFFSEKIKSFKNIKSSWSDQVFYFPESSLGRYSKLKNLENKERMKIEEIPVQYKFFWI